MSAISDEATCAGLRIDEVIIQDSESTHLAKIILNIARYTTNNTIHIAQIGKGNELGTPTDRQQLSYDIKVQQLNQTTTGYCNSGLSYRSLGHQLLCGL